MADLVAEAVKFMRHDGLCDIVGGYGYCTCGMDKARDEIERLRASPLTTERREWLKAICRRSRETFIRRAGTKNGIAQYGADIDGAIVDDLLAALIAGPVSEGEE